MAIFQDDSILLHLAMGYTLVDISQTGVVTGNSKERNQQRNWEAVIQVLGLRTQVLTISQPEIISFNVTGSMFGSNFTGTHTIWTFKFGVEQDLVYSNNTGPYGALYEDFNNVPVILWLDETATISTPTFCTSGPNRNIYFESIKI